MSPNLQAPTKEILISNNHISKSHRTLGLRCHDRHFRDAIVCDESGAKLFDFTAKDLGSSWTLRRSLIDATTNQHILDLRHTKMSYKSWIIEDGSGTQLCKIKDVTNTWTGKFTAVDAQVENQDGSIQLRSFDKAGSRTSFMIDGVTVGELTLLDDNDASFLHKRGLDRTNWRLEVAEGVDMALFVTLAFARAEVCHAWRR